jgi:Smg protein
VQPGFSQVLSLPGGPVRERVLAIVNLIAKYVLGAEDAPINEQELVAELMSVGFEAEEINDAFSWMESAALQSTDQQKAQSELKPPPTYRIFSREEQHALSTEGIGFLIKIRNMGLLADEAQEEIIERAVRAAEDPLGLQEVKMIAALTMLSRSNSLWQREIDCFLDNDWTRIYH